METYGKMKIFRLLRPVHTYALKIPKGVAQLHLQPCNNFKKKLPMRFSHRFLNWTLTLRLKILNTKLKANKLRFVENVPLNLCTTASHAKVCTYLQYAVSKPQKEEHEEKIF